MFSWKRLPIWLGLQEKHLLKCGPQPRWIAEGNSSRVSNLTLTLSLVFYRPIDGRCSKSQPKQKTITRLPPTNNQPQYIPRQFRARWLASSEIISKYQYLSNRGIALKAHSDCLLKLLMSYFEQLAWDLRPKILYLKLSFGAVLPHCFNKRFNNYSP